MMFGEGSNQSNINKYYLSVNYSDLFHIISILIYKE
jgi:hypothetical protein